MHLAGPITPQKRAVDGRKRVFFIYLGRRGPLGRFTLELGQATKSIPALTTSFAVADQNPIAKDLSQLGIKRVEKVHTFQRNTPFSILTDFFSARRQLLAAIEEEQPAAVINLMPHIWTPVLSKLIRGHDVPYAVIIHDAMRHPGDPTGFLTPWLRREARSANHVVALSRSVAAQLVSLGLVDERNIKTLFHPDLHYGAHAVRKQRPAASPFRLLFFGRILKYKGLTLLISAIEMLRQTGLRIELGVVGNGDLGPDRKRLEQLNAEIVNHWIEDAEIYPLLARYDAVALPYLEASQSGVAATAFGSGMPVIGLPAGGIEEQVIDGTTGLLAADCTEGALAEAIHKLATDGNLYNRLTENLCRTAEERSMSRFLIELLNAVGLG